MKGNLFFFALSIVVCAMASSIPKNFCSVSGEGNATVNSEPMTVKMLRVRNTARFDFKDLQDNPSFSFLVRPDVHGLILFNYTSSTCKSVDGYLEIEEFKFFETSDAFDVFQYDSNTIDAKLWFNHNTEEIEREEIKFKDYSGETVLLFNISYTDRNYQYEHDKIDDAFSINSEECSRGARSNATAAVSAVCFPPKTFTPKLPGCAFEMKITTDDGGGTDYIYKVVTKDVAFGYLKTQKQNGDDFEVIRCDYMDDSGKCQQVWQSKTCEAGYVSFKRELEFFADFNYYGNPETLKCPNSSDDCYNYIDYTTGVNLVATKEGYVIQKTDRLSIKYLDTVPSMEDFAVTMCDNQTKLDAPLDICSAKQLVPKYPKCAFEMNVTPDTSVVVKVLVGDSYGYQAYTKNNKTTVVRCDVTNDKGNCLVVTHRINEKGGIECKEEYDRFELFDAIEFYGEPEKVKCPDGSEPCWNYTNPLQRIYVITDNEGYFVDFNGILAEYLDTVPSMEEFAVERCNDGGKLEAPVDPCSQSTQSSSASATVSSASATVSSASFSLPSVVVVVALALILYLF